MSGSSEQLIRDLARDLSAVKRLPRLRFVALSVVGAAGVCLGLYLVLELAQGHTVFKSKLAASDVLGSTGHLVVGGGALLLALASCVPGRDPMVRAGAWALGAGATVTLAAAITLLSVQAVAPIANGFFAGTAACTLTAVVPALIPAAILAAFVARGAPSRPTLTLCLGALAVTSLGTLPGHLGCMEPGTLHTLVGHLLAPVTGGAAIFAGMRLLYRPALPQIR